MKKLLVTLFSFIVIALASPVFVSAQSGPPAPATPTNSPAMLNKLKSVGGQAGYNAGTTSSTFLTVIGTVVNIVLSLLGVVFIILIIVAGFNWMTAGGDEEKIKKAGATIRAAIIGLLIVIGAFAIWLFISTAIFGSSSTTPGSNPPPPIGN